jgi:hypothetical protein
MVDSPSDRWAHFGNYEKNSRVKRGRRQDYDDITSDTGDISIVAARYGLSETAIERAKDHAFGSGVSRYEFFPERLMVEAWRRSVSDTGKALDEMFLKHKIYESDLVIDRGHSQKQAHLCSGRRLSLV